MRFLLPLLLIGCVPETDDSGKDSTSPDACACEPAQTIELPGANAGGYDDWAGTAVTWAVDPTHGRALVVAAAFTLPVSQVEIAPDCTGADALAGDWHAAVPDSATSDVARWPLLGTILTDAAGAHSLTAHGGALLVEGDLATTTPDRVLVATGGTVTLTRGEGEDSLQGALDFAAVATGGHATDQCGDAVTVAGIDLSWVGGGTE